MHDSETESGRCCSAATAVLHVGVPPGPGPGPGYQGVVLVVVWAVGREGLWPVAVGRRLGLDHWMGLATSSRQLESSRLDP